jgi:predicted enzyme related to lactoylglutathione lyase
MKRVTGIGGLFFKTKDVAKIKDWYRDRLGFKTTDWGATFVWGDSDPGKKTISRTEWSPFKADTDYFRPSEKPFMINYRVHDLHKLMDQLKKEGIASVGEIQEFEYGKFGWIMDPEGNKLELWEPVDEKFGDAPQVWDERVTGLGGVFFKAENPKELKAWYKEHLDIPEFFRWKNLGDPATDGLTTWCPFDKNTDYFSPSDKPYMFNYRVKNLQSLLGHLEEEGVKSVKATEKTPYGDFGWIMDPDGNKIELWEPRG